MSKESWDERAVKALQRFITWWHSDSPERKLSMDESHGLVNAVLVAKHLVYLKERESDNTEER